jgi:hypothetical protein
MPCYKQIEWEGKFFRLGRCCYFCGNPLTIRSATKEHLTPKSRGGSDELLNIVPACWRCNHLKGTRTAEEFRRDFPKICKLSTANPTLTTSTPVISYEEKNEPGLLKRLVHEQERASWAWRNPVSGKISEEEIEEHRLTLINALEAASPITEKL